MTVRSSHINRFLPFLRIQDTSIKQMFCQTMFNDYLYDSIQKIDLVCDVSFRSPFQEKGHDIAVTLFSCPVKSSLTIL